MVINLKFIQVGDDKKNPLSSILASNPTGIYPHYHYPLVTFIWKRTIKFVMDRVH